MKHIVITERPMPEVSHYFKKGDIVQKTLIFETQSGLFQYSRVSDGFKQLLRPTDIKLQS